MRWNLRMTAAERGIWKSTELRRRLAEAGLEISAGKMSALWTGTPTMVRLDDLDVICVVLQCAPEDLLKPEPDKVAARRPSQVKSATGSEGEGDHTAARTQPDPAAGVIQGRPRPCQRCGLKPRAARRTVHCFDCMPGGPIAPPPCRRCGATTDFYASGLCSRCHHYAPQRVDSCRDCHAWGAARTNKWLCRACVTWRIEHPVVASCTTCGDNVNVSARRICRLCHSQARRTRVHRELFNVRAASRLGAQLFFADMHKKRTNVARRPVDVVAPARPPWPDRPVAHRQLLLFVQPWQLAGNRRTVGPARDQVLAEALDAQVAACAAVAGWPDQYTSDVRCGIRLLLAMQDTPGAAIAASEAQVLTQLRLPVRTVMEVLDEVGMLDDDRTPAITRWFEQRTVRLPEPMGGELRVWFDVMHLGATTPPRTKPRHPTTIKIYLAAVLPALKQWTDDGHDSLREITHNDVVAALPPAGARRGVFGRGARSIFATLKARKVIFANPMVNVEMGSDSNQPPGFVDLDGVRLALNSPDPARALIAALAAYHGLRSGQLIALHLTDVRDRQLHIGERVIPLAETVRRTLPRLAQPPGCPLADDDQSAPVHPLPHHRPASTPSVVDGSGSHSTCPAACRRCARTASFTRPSPPAATPDGCATCSASALDRPPATPTRSANQVSIRADRSTLSLRMSHSSR